MKIEPEIAVRLVKKWLDLLELGGWSLAVAVHNSPDESPRPKVEAWCHAQPEISHALIEFNAYQFEDMEHFDRIACHESLHVLFAFTELAMKGAVKPKKLARALIEWPVERIAIALTKKPETPPGTLVSQTTKESKR